VGYIIAFANDDDSGARQSIAGGINHLSIQRGCEKSKQWQPDDILLIELDGKALNRLLAKTVLGRCDLIGARRQIENGVVSRLIRPGRTAISVLFIFNSDLRFTNSVARLIAHQTEERTRCSLSVELRSSCEQKKSAEDYQPSSDGCHLTPVHEVELPSLNWPDSRFSGL